MWKLATFTFFLIAGFIPLISFVAAIPFSAVNKYSFILSFILTAVALFIVGVFKGKIVGKHAILSAFETLLVGGAAAVIAFIVGVVV